MGNLYGYTSLSVTRETVDAVNAFQVTLARKTGTILTKSEAIQYALAIATKALDQSPK